MKQIEIERTIWFWGLVLLSCIDLSQTYYALNVLNGLGELNPVYHMLGWGIVILIKFMALFIVYYLDYRFVGILKIYTFLQLVVIYQNFYNLLTIK